MTIRLDQFMRASEGEFILSTRDDDNKEIRIRIKEDSNPAEIKALLELRMKENADQKTADDLVRASVETAITEINKVEVER